MWRESECLTRGNLSQTHKVFFVVVVVVAVVVAILHTASDIDTYYFRVDMDHKRKQSAHDDKMRSSSPKRNKTTIASVAAAATSSSSASQDDALPPTYAEATNDAPNRSYVRIERLGDPSDDKCSALRLSSVMEFKDNVRTPVDYTILLDVSSSMDVIVKGCTEGSGFKRIQLAIHSLRIWIGTLSSEDFLTIVTFSSSAEVALSRIPMTPDNAAKALKFLDNVTCGGYTNLMDGLKTAYTFMRMYPLPQTKEQFINRHIVVLTDGQPNLAIGKWSAQPEKNAIDINAYYELMDAEFKECPASRHVLVHTFGLTPDSLNDRLLSKIAQHGHGMYGFISDASIVSPCFINILAVCFHMWVTGLELHLNDAKGQCIHRIPVPWILQSGFVDVVLPTALKNATYDTLTPKLISNTSRTMRLMTASSDNHAAQAALQAWQGVQLRQEVVEALLEASDRETVTSAECQLRVRKWANELMRRSKETPSYQLWSDAQKTWLSDLIRDVDMEHRIHAAAWTSWPTFYTHSLAMSLQDDYVTNGYEQSYKTKSGPRLRYWLDNVEHVAKKILPPNPSIQPYKGDGGSSSAKAKVKTTAPPPAYASSSNSASSYGAAAAAASSNYSYFSSSSGRDYDDGCIDGECSVEMASGIKKKVKDVRIGDSVRTDSLAGTGMIRCVLSIPSDRAIVVDLPDQLRITHMHPIRDNNKDWMWPIAHACHKRIIQENPVSMYSFLLEKPASEASQSTAMLVNGWWVAHFAHGNIDNTVLAHPFYGSERIRDTVERIDPERTGFIKIDVAVRHEITDAVIDYTGTACEQTLA